MIVVTNTIKVKKGYGETVANRFENSKGIDLSPGFLRMEVLFTEGLEECDELKVSTTWENKASFEGWVNSDSFRQAHAYKGSHKSAEGKQTECVMLGSQLTTHRVLVARQAGIVQHSEGVSDAE
ncbi:heme oxygenase (staphylobilin-producing) [Paenibacillus endophyticus]|uniref:Heme oxygenase (Staphylobilin-producing) n=1 Tax=Paenibacillus endophyticus TaxID=1294268 RepID=A0A7W5GEG9_9BACL|nr:antibiotic biosynthesis monooxygenase [Paenibacillus endophyticus]MBB3156117.1 heme oxygenase (staphylobilin-producing) [Paenibacillus endophyticus]